LVCVSIHFPKRFHISVKVTELVTIPKLKPFEVTKLVYITEHQSVEDPIHLTVFFCIPVFLTFPVIFTLAFKESIK
jgi:hypothetical protein